MQNTKLFLAAALLLGLGACTYSAVEHSGGSGMESNGDGSAYSRYPSYGPYASFRGSGGCLPDDTNCWQFYNNPGGG
jgi:hypothetical protein